IVSDISVGTKRGSEELHSAGFSNGPSAMNSGSTTANGNDSKKFKGDSRGGGGAGGGGPGLPSRVLHFRKLPSDVSETEVISLAMPFGKVTNILMLKGKNQAFLEMSSEESAVTMVNYYTTVTLHVRSQPVFVQYSNHRELKTDNSPHQARAQAALHAFNSSVGGGRWGGAWGGAWGGGAHGGPRHSVLHVVVENLFYPVTLDVLHQIFSKFGTVLKVITFTKNNQFQALLQYADPIHAHQSKMALDGQNIYNACCTLRVDFSKLTSLNVKYNNDKSRDYTRPDLPSGDGPSGGGGGGGGGNPYDNAMVAAFGAPGIIQSPYGAGFPAAIGFPQTPAQHYRELQHYRLAMPGQLGPLGLPAAVSAVASAAMRGVTLPGMGGGVGNTVLLVSNLNAEMVTPQSLFVLFGVYGDVQRVKILFNKKDNALVQMADSNQAQLAMSHLNGVRKYGKNMRVALSKHQTVQLPREGHEDQGLNQGLWGLAAASLQEARLQELPEHLSALRHPPPVQHPV
ncbi:unnamed protein product, partial [Lampetra planeri]